MKQTPVEMMAEALREIETNVNGIVMHCIIPDSFDNEDRESDERCVGCEFLDGCSLLEILASAGKALAALDGMVVIPADEYELLQLYKAHSTADLKGMELVPEGKVEGLESEIERLSRWLRLIDGGDNPCTSESTLRQWAYEAVTLGHSFNFDSG